MIGQAFSVFFLYPAIQSLCKKKPFLGFLAIFCLALFKIYEIPTSYYEILDISYPLPMESGSKFVKSQYRKRSLAYHPDKSTADQEKFVSLQSAVKVLESPTLRKLYDLHGVDGTTPGFDPWIHSAMRTGIEILMLSIMTRNFYSPVVYLVALGSLEYLVKIAEVVDFRDSLFSKTPPFLVFEYFRALFQIVILLARIFEDPDNESTTSKRRRIIACLQKSEAEILRFHKTKEGHPRTAWWFLRSSLITEKELEKKSWMSKIQGLLFALVFLKFLAK
jgi:DnaJ domain